MRGFSLGRRHPSVSACCVLAHDMGDHMGYDRMSGERTSGTLRSD
jgi:hypothetical protein